MKRLLLIFVFCCAGGVASSAHAQSCGEALVSTQKELDNIETEIKAANSQTEYREEVKQRYDKVEVLLFMATACSQNTSLPEKDVKMWNSLMRALTSLQASAKTSAFTKFADWREAKESDLNATKQAD